MKLTHTIVLFLLFMPLFNVIAQDIPAVEKNLFKIDILDPGFTFEHGLTTKSTLVSGVGLTLAYSYSDYFGSSFTMTPFISEEYRYYCNFDRRVRKGKNISRNSGNYIGSSVAYYFKPITHQQQTFVGATQIAVFGGFQRTYKVGFNLNFQAGVGYVIANSDDEGFTPYLKFTMGWVLGKRK